METCKVKNLLLIAFNSALGKGIKEEFRQFIDIDEINSMVALENSAINCSAVIYLMDLTNADHIYNIRYIRDKYPDQQFFVISSTLSIPLLHQSLHIGIDDLFLSPLSEQDRNTLLEKLKNKTCVGIFNDVINKNGNDAICFPKTKKLNDVSCLLDVIEFNYAKGPSLQDLANDIHLSPSRICHLFKDACGITYSYYLLCRKIEEGERLLTLAEHSITHISYQVGFANPSHFCRTFKEHFSITPTAYLNGNRDVQYSETYLRYQRLRSELFSSASDEAQKNIDGLVGKYHVS